MKNVIVIDDKLGTMALGFSKAGYDVKGIYVEREDKLNYEICKENWGEIVKGYDKEFGYEINRDIEIDYIAGNLDLKEKQKKKYRGETRKTTILDAINEIHPKSFLLKCSNSYTADRIRKIMSDVANKYYINIWYCDTRILTGYPVIEKFYCVVGSFIKKDINIEVNLNADILNYSVKEFCDSILVDDRWCYYINEKHLMQIRKSQEEGIYCWKNNCYKKEEFITWNCRMLPIMKCDNIIRKLTYREIARLKGIPNEYNLICKNRNKLYEKLMYSSNVRAIQQLAASLYLMENEEQFAGREISKTRQFEKIVCTYLKYKGLKKIKDENNSNPYIDLHYINDHEKYGFVCRMYNGKIEASTKASILCEKISESCVTQEEIIILLIGNIVSSKTKKYIQEKYKIIICDIENILWILEEFPILKSEFAALSSFNMSQIIAKKPDTAKCAKNNESTIKIDLQEQLRKIKPGKDSAKEYEKICTYIVKFLFSDHIEFYSAQKKSNAGLYCFDCCGKIKYGTTSEFFNTVKQFFSTKYIIFEFKNYTEMISQKEIYTTEKYLYEKALRKVAIVISRKGSDENAQKAARGSLRELGKLIIVLADEDLNRLIDMKNNNEDPSDYLEALLDNMLMDLEK